MDPPTSILAIFLPFTLFLNLLPPCLFVCIWVDCTKPNRPTTNNKKKRKEKVRKERKNRAPNTSDKHKARSRSEHRWHVCAHGVVVCVCCMGEQSPRQESCMSTGHRSIDDWWLTNMLQLAGWSTIHRYHIIQSALRSLRISLSHPYSPADRPSIELN